MTAATLPIVTTSERRAFKRCPWRWWHEYREGLRSTVVSDKLWFGIGIHEALAVYYPRGLRRNLKACLEVWDHYCDSDDMSLTIRETLADGERIWHDSRELGLVMLKGHNQFWDRDKAWDVIYTEEPFQILIPHPDKPKKDIAVFTSTFDGVYRNRYTKKTYLMEHKTAASIAVGHLPMDDQGGAYWAVATQVLRDKGILGKKEAIHGITYNFLRKGKPDPRPTNAAGQALNKDGSVSKSQPSSPLFHREEVIRTPRERVTQIIRIGNEVKAMDLMKQGVVEPWKTPTRDCSWDCPFYNMCQLHDMGQDWEEYKDLRYVQADPYDRYRMRKSASG